MTVSALDLVQAEAERLLRRVTGRPAVLGLCGSQGSGKSTLARALADRIEGTVILSLDDLYLTKAERVALGESVHPLLRTRGVPGTHDVSLGLAMLDSIAQGVPPALPRFDKSRDDRAAMHDWPQAPFPARLVIFEGWCVGARPQKPAELETPINALEQIEDPRAIWRRYVDACLAGAYQTLFARIDALVLLAAPGFDTILDWRIEQEEELRSRVGVAAAALMDKAQIARFVAHYERLTRSILEEMPLRADLTIDLDERRRVVATRAASDPRQGHVQ